MLASRTLLSKRHYTKVTHCLFDLDGTVLDSEVIYHKMLKQICGKYDKHYSRELEIKTYGLTDAELCVVVVEELKLSISADEFQMQLTDLAKKKLPSAPLQKGAERLLTHLYEYKVPMALATNSTEYAVRLHAVRRPKLFGVFHHMVSATDREVTRGKPYPDVYLVAASRFPDNPPPRKVVMIPDPRIDREETRRATLVIPSLLHFKPELFGLPAFDDRPGDVAKRNSNEHTV